MYDPDTYDFKSFYSTATGRITRRILRNQMREFLSDPSLTILGQGYTAPYLQSVDHKDQSARKSEDSVDRILAIHHIEFADNIKDTLKRDWLLLKPNEGRLLIVVPNRHGLWASKDWTPFGHGMPFSLRQIQHYLHEARFEIISTREALFVPPSRRSFILRMAKWFESAGRLIIPAAAGVHIIEAKKVMYAPTGLLTRDKPKIRTNTLFPEPTS
jgi:hypothetical protein